MTIESEIVTYQQVADGYQIQNDPFGIGKYTLEDSIKKTFLKNPNLKDFSKCMVFFDRVNGAIGGRQMFFPTRLKIGEEIVYVQSGSSLQTVPEYRQYAIGMDMINYPIKGKEYPFIIYAGIAKMALPIYKALRFSFLEMPEYWQPRNCKFIFQHVGIKGYLLTILTRMSNCFLKTAVRFIKYFNSLETREFKINQLNKVSKWVDDIVLNDTHKYAELHDSSWMQWTLDNNFFNKTGDRQAFYEIRRGSEVLGFFLIKERCSELPEHHIDKVVFGNVYEWGTIDEVKLSEETITRIAMNFFSKNVDIVTISSRNRLLSRKLKWMFAFRHGNTTIIIKDLTKKCKDISNPDNWRLRSGYCDCPFY